MERFELRENDPVLKSWEEILQCLQFLHSEEHDYKTVVLDSIDFAEPLVERYVIAQHGEQDIESFGFGKGYVHAANEVHQLTGWFDALRNDRGMAVIVIGHSQTKVHNAPDSESYDRYKLSVRDRIAEHIHNWSDSFLFCNYVSHVVKDEQQGKKKGEGRARAVGVGERVIYTEERPAWRAKNRYGLPPILPLSWQAFQDAVAAGAADEPKPTQTKSGKGK